MGDSNILSTKGILGKAIFKVKNSTAAASRQLQPQFQRSIEFMQPKLNRVVANASARLEKMQPHLDKAKQKTSKGWDKLQPGVSMFMNALKMSTPLAERIHSIAIKLSDQLIITQPLASDSTFKKVTNNICARSRGLRFLQDYKEKNHLLVSHHVKNNSSVDNSNNAVDNPPVDNPPVDNPPVDNPPVDNGQELVATESFASKRSFESPFLLFTIITFCGSIDDLLTFSLLNHQCRCHVNGEPRLWKWCVRFGTLSNTLRSRFWMDISRSSEKFRTYDRTFDHMSEAGGKGEWVDAIWTDVKRTYGKVAPHKRSEHAEDLYEELAGQESLLELQSQLSMVLYGLAELYSDVGYCQGMDYVAAHVLRSIKTRKNVDPHGEQQTGIVLDLLSPTDPKRIIDSILTEEAEQTFWLLVVMFDTYGLKRMYSPGLEQLHLACYQFRRLFSTYLPVLAAHFQSVDIIVEMIVVGWFQTLFMYMNSMPLDTLNRIWDIFLFEKSWKIFFRVSIAILQLAQPYLEGQSIDTIMNRINTFPGNMQDILQPEILLTTALDIKISNKILDHLAREADDTTKS